MNKLTKKDKEHVERIKIILEQKFGDLVKSLYCYGSRVTKNVQDTDFDILVLTKENIDWKKELEISRTIIRYGIENDIVFDPQIFNKDDFEINLKFSPFIQNVKLTGIYV